MGIEDPCFQPDSVTGPETIILLNEKCLGVSPRKQKRMLNIFFILLNSAFLLGHFFEIFQISDPSVRFFLRKTACTFGNSCVKEKIFNLPVVEDLQILLLYTKLSTRSLVDFYR